MKIHNIDYQSTRLKEAEVEFFLPEKKPKNEEENKIGKSMSVFYNPRMIINRDLTIYVVNTYSSQRSTKLNYCDSMAATGIRAIRLLKQCPAIEKVFINDLNPIAIETVQKNLQINGITQQQIQISSLDAKLLFSTYYDQNHTYYDIIDIDPFGSPSEYIPSAMQAISVHEVGGLMCVTATDTPVLFGIKKEACIRKYLTTPIRTEFIKEMGTRILIYFIAKIANLFELYVHPVMSISAQHFVRVFLHIRKGILGVNSNIQKFGNYLYCRSCHYRSVEKVEQKSTILQCTCPLCGNIMIASGLVWMGNLHDPEYVQDLDIQLQNTGKNMYPSYNQLLKFVELVKNEDNFPPYYYSIPKIADYLGITYPSLLKILERLEEKGFHAARTHFDPQAVKTEASITVVKEVLKEFQT